MEQADRTDGDIDTLSTRIAHIRTWTFAANRPDWLADPEHWQGVTRAVEDKLSDALHERLTERFVDRRTSVLMRRLRENTMLETEIAKSGDVVVEGHVIGRLDGFSSCPIRRPRAGGEGVRGAAQKALAGEIDARATRLAHAAGRAIRARLRRHDPLARRSGRQARRRRRSARAARAHHRRRASHRCAARCACRPGSISGSSRTSRGCSGRCSGSRAAEDVTGIARGVAFQLVEALGVIERQKVADEVKGLDQAARATLRKYGVRFGAYHIYLPALLKPAPRALAEQLWALKRGGCEAKGLEAIEQLAASGRTSFAADKDIAKVLYRTVGYRVCGERAVRVDILERLADLIRPALAWRAGRGGEKPAGAVDGSASPSPPAMTSLTGCSGEDFASVLRSLGYRMEKRPKPAEPPPAARRSRVSGACGIRRSRRCAQVMPGTAAAARGCRGARERPIDEPQGDAAAETDGAESGPVAAAPVRGSGDRGRCPAGTRDRACRLHRRRRSAEAVRSVETSAGPAGAAGRPAPNRAAEPARPRRRSDRARGVATEEFIEVWRPGRPRRARSASPAPRTAPRQRRASVQARRPRDAAAAVRATADGRRRRACRAPPAASPPADGRAGERAAGAFARRCAARGTGPRRPAQRAGRPERSSARRRPPERVRSTCARDTRPAATRRPYRPAARRAIDPIAIRSCGQNT